MKRIALFTLFAMLSFSISCFAQKGKWGLSMTNANTIGAAYFLEDNMRLGAEVGFQSVSNGGSSTDLSVGVGLWYYLAKVENLNTFVGGGIGFGSNSGGGQTSSSLSIMGQYGAEYWVSSKIGVNGYIGVGYGSSGPSGAKTSTLSTISGIGLTWLLN